ncbi:flippase [Acidobacteriota bacterium]
MSLGTRILKNTTYLTVGDKFGYVIQFIFFLYFARKFGVAPTGEYSFGFTYTYAFIVFADMGISIYLVREVARDYSAGRELFIDCLILKAVGLVLSLCLASATLILFFDNIPDKKLKVMICWGGYWIFYSIADVFLAELKGHEKMGQVAVLGIFLKVLSTAAGIILIHLGFDYDAVLIVLPISSFIYFCCCVLVSVLNLGFFHVKLRNPSHYGNLIKELFPFILTVILVEVLYQEDILILGIMKNDRSVGIYSASIKLVSFVLGISPFFHVAMLPVLARLFLESKKRLIEVSKKTLRYLIILGLPISVGIVATSNEIINLFYSESFQEASIVLKIAGWTIAVGLVQAIFSVVLTAINRQKEKVLFIGINFGLITVLNLILIYFFDYVGAAIAKLLAEIFALFFFMFLVKKYLANLSIIKPLLKPALASILMAVFIYSLRNWHLLILIPISGGVYLLVFILSGGLTVDEVKLIRKFFQGKRHIALS